MTLTEEGVFKRLKSLDLTQESVETVSLWCLHHKDSFDLITSTWITVFRTDVTYDDGSDVDEKFLMDFETSNLIGDLEKYEKSESSIEKAQALLPATNFDFRGKLKDCLKDRKEGIHIVHEVDDAYQKMAAFVSALETQVLQHHRLIGLLEQARSFYGQQLRDATVVDDAYEKFKTGIENVKDQLEEMQRTGVFLGASPPRDAPSPTPCDDPFAEGVEAAIVDLKKPGARDIIEASDMDIEEETALSRSTSTFENIITAANFHTNQSFLPYSGQKGVMDSPVQRTKLDPRLERFQRTSAESKFPVQGAEPMDIAGGLVAHGIPGVWNGTCVSSSAGITPWTPGIPQYPPAAGPSPQGALVPPFDFSVPPPVRPQFCAPMTSTPASGPIITSSSPFNEENEVGTGRGGCNQSNLTVLSGGQSNLTVLSGGHTSIKSRYSYSKQGITASGKFGQN